MLGEIAFWAPQVAIENQQHSYYHASKVEKPALSGLFLV